MYGVLMSILEGFLSLRSLPRGLRSARTRPLLEVYEFTLNEGNTIMKNNQFIL
jgi:hypothetical protein